MTATVSKLSALHGKLADTFVAALEHEQASIEDPEVELNIALLKTISSFLKENSITTDLTDGEDNNATLSKLEQLKTKRANRITSTPLDGFVN